MKKSANKGILSGVILMVSSIILSFIIGRLMDNDIVTFDTLKLFEFNLVTVIVMLLAALIPICLCRFKKFIELFVYSFSFFVTHRILFLITYVGLYAIALTAEHYGFNVPFQLPDEFMEAVSFNMIYMGFGIFLGILGSIIMNIIINRTDKKNINIDTEINENI